MKYRALITDADGVVFDSVPRYRSIVTEVFHGEGISFTSEMAEILDKNIGVHTITLFEEQYGFHKEDALRLYKKMEGLELANPPKLISGVQETLQLLERNFYMVMFSSRNKINLLSALEFNDIDRFFDFISTADTCQFTKPDPRALDEVMTYLGSGNIMATECLYVGDTLSDVHCGLGRGIKVLPVLSGGGTKKQFLEAGIKPRNIIPSLVDIFDWLDKNDPF